MCRPGGSLSTVGVDTAVTGVLLPTTRSTNSRAGGRELTRSVPITGSSLTTTGVSAPRAVLTATEVDRDPAR